MVLKSLRKSLRERSALGLARMAGFYLSVLVFVFFWLLAFNFQLYAVFVGWFDPVLSETVHFVHDIALATWVWVWGAAMVVQLYKPAKRVAAMRIVLVVTLIDAGLGIGIGQFEADALLFFAPVFVAAALHPARGELFGRGLSRESLDPVVFGLAALTVVPVVLYVLGQVEFQRVLTDDHAALGHYSTMGYYGLSIVALALLAGVVREGRRVTAIAAGLLAAMLGVVSLVRPELMSALDSMWAVAAILWAVAVVAAAAMTTRRDAPRRTSVPTESAEPSP